MATEQLDRNLQTCVDSVAAAIDGVFARLQMLEQQVRRIWAAHDAATGVLSRRDFKALRPLIEGHLRTSCDGLQGTGVVLEPGVLPDADMYLEWHQIHPNGRTSPLDLNFNCSSDRYYNYCDMPWFSLPRSSGKRVVVGPYIDLYGQDMYVLTFAQPINIQGKFIGIAGADIALDRFETVLMRALLKLDHEALLLTGQGRVVTANTARFGVGELALNLPALLDDNGQVVDLGVDGIDWRLFKRATLRPRIRAA